MNHARSSNVVFAPLLIAALTGCGGGGAGDATLTAPGKAPEKLTFASGAALVDSGSRITMVTGCDLTCDDYKKLLASDDYVKGLGAKCGKFFELTFFKQTGKLTPGKYGAPGSASKTPVEASPSVWNADGTATTFALFSGKAKADTTEITSVSDTEIAGTIHVDDGGSSLQGTFRAKVCKP